MHGDKLGRVDNFFAKETPSCIMGAWKGNATEQRPQ